VSFARLVLLVFIAYRLYVLLFTPLYIVKNMEETGYIQHLEKHVRDDIWTRQIVRRRKRGEVPPVYPNGWFCVLNSCQLKKGTAQSVTVLGKQLAVFRGEDNQPYVLDAYCPHLGANLGCGGQVRGNCLECPFHGWSFRGDDGKCMHVPYAEKVPEFAKTTAHTVVEMNGYIYVWHHAEGIEPDWMPEEIVEITNGKWRCVGMTEHNINCHIQV
jgi:cholesterol 7-dehydrogenase